MMGTLPFFQIVNIMLPGGERCPALIHRNSGLPLRVAVRWVMRYRRRIARPQTIRADLYTMGLIYQWAWDYGRIDLDNLLTSGQILNPQQLQALIVALEQASPQRSNLTVSGEVVDRRLSTASNFLTWALYPEHRGGTTALSCDELAIAHGQIEHTFRFARIGVVTSKRMEPFTAEEVLAIRHIIAAVPGSNGRWCFPNTCFLLSTRLRNWLMILTFRQC